MAKTEKKWYVLRAASGKEFKVKEYIDAEIKHNPLLEAHVSQVVLPLEKHATLRNGKRVVKEKISLPGYVFVEAALVGDVAHTLRFMPNVLGFLGGWSTLKIKQLSRNRLTAFFVLGNMLETTNSSLQKECIFKEQHRNSPKIRKQ